MHSVCDEKYNRTIHDCVLLQLTWPTVSRASIRFSTMCPRTSSISSFPTSLPLLAHAYGVSSVCRGGNAASYIYRLLSERYHEDDFEL